MGIEKDDFVAYYEVQMSGVTNMFDTRAVGELTGLSKEQIREIMANYTELKEKFI